MLVFELFSLHICLYYFFFFFHFNEFIFYVQNKNYYVCDLIGYKRETSQIEINKKL